MIGNSTIKVEHSGKHTYLLDINLEENLKVLLLKVMM